jgi:hypothetical protein
MIGVFLALLELIREKKILVEQLTATDDVEIIPAPEEHRRTYAHASLHLATEEPDEEQPAEAPGITTEATEHTENTEGAEESSKVD